MTRFTDIPTADFPLNYTTYCRLRSEIGSISARFSDLGTRDGAEVAKKMEEVHQAFDHAWDTIRGIERREEREERLFNSLSGRICRERWEKSMPLTDEAPVRTSSTPSMPFPSRTGT